MRHAGTQELETDRLFLRRLLPEDADMMYANWASDPQVTRFLRWEPHKNALETLGLLAAWATLYPNPDYYQWAIVEKASGQVFGSISIFNALLGDAGTESTLAGAGLHRRHLGSRLLHREAAGGTHGFATEALKQQ
ncbi:MAG: GNAT family N-acetyltransferase [Faecalibacterium sp.]